MARAISTKRKTILTLLAWFIALVLFFPILWTFLTSFKTEAEAIASPPSLFGFEWTLENYTEVQSRSNYFKHFKNSIIIAVGSTLLGLLVAVPAAWAFAFQPTKRTRSILMWMLSTKMLPPVGVLIPILLLFRDYKLMDTHIGLIMVMMLINLPIMIWMLFTYFREIPADILEASRMDGASLSKEILYVLILKPRRLVLRKAQRGFCHGNSAYFDNGLVQSKAIGSWLDIRGGEIMGVLS